MDVFLVVLTFSFALLASLFVFVWNLSSEGGNASRQAPEIDEANEEEPQNEIAHGNNNNNNNNNRGGRRRGRLADLARQRREIEIDEDAPIENDDNENTPAPNLPADFSKMGAKKRKKLLEKEERRKANEARQEYLQQQRKLREEEYERQQEEKRRRAEEEKALAEEEKERQRKLEEEREKDYRSWMGEMTVEETGQDQETEEEKEKKIEELIQFVQQEKVVELESLCGRFGFRTNDLVEKLTELDQNGRLPGIIDDRGKFIHITQEEMDGVARFIKRRGRLSIDDIIAESNRLIDLAPRSGN